MSPYSILILLCIFSFSSPTPIQKRYFALKYDWGSDDNSDSSEPQKDDEEGAAGVGVEEDGTEGPNGDENGDSCESSDAAPAASDSDTLPTSGTSTVPLSSGKKGKKGKKEGKGGGKKKGKKKKGGKGSSSAAAAAAASSGKESAAAAAAAAANGDDGDEEEPDSGDGGDNGNENPEGGDEGNNGEDEGPHCGGYSAAAAAAALGGLTSAAASAAVTSQVSFTPFKQPTCPCSPTGSYRNMGEISYGEGTTLRGGKRSTGNSDLELEQYVLSMMSATGLRLRPLNCDGRREKESYLTVIQYPDRYNLAQPCELWVFEPHIVSGKRVYLIRNVQRGLYLRASPHLYRKYYHVCGLKPRDPEDMSMYWELTGWSIRNLLYDEYLTHSPRNSSGYGMTHPITKDTVSWVLTKKSDLSKLSPVVESNRKRI